MNSLPDKSLNRVDLSQQALLASLIAEQYTNSIEAIVDEHTFLTTLSSTIDVQGNKINPGEIPGVKTICGTVFGNRFKIRKAGAFANPCTKDVVGLVEPSETGTVIKYNLVARPLTTGIQAFVFIGLASFGLLCLAMLFINFNYVSIDKLGQLTLYCLGIPAFLLFLFIVVSKIGEMSGESDQEELLDHIKKLAAGISVSS